MVNVLTGLNDLKTKVDGLGVVNLKTVPIDLKEFSDVMGKTKKIQWMTSLIQKYRE